MYKLTGHWRQPFWIGYIYLPEITVSASMKICRHPAPFSRHSAMLGLSCESAVYPVITRTENRKLGLIISPSHLHHRLIPQQTGNLAATQHLNIGKKCDSRDLYKCCWYVNYTNCLVWLYKCSFKLILAHSVSQFHAFKDVGFF